MTVALVQATSGGQDSNAPVLSAASNFTPTNLLVVPESLYYTPPVGLQIGGMAATRVAAVEAVGGTFGDYAACWYVVADGTISGKDVTITTTSGCDFVEWAVLEFSSTTGWPADPVAASGATPTTANGNSANPSASVTTTAPIAVIVSCWSNGANGAGDDGTVPSGYTRAFTAVASEGGAGAYQIATSAGTKTPVHAVAGGAVPWGCLTVAFSPNAGGGGAPTPLAPISASVPSALSSPTPQLFAGVVPAGPSVPVGSILRVQTVDRSVAPSPRTFTGFGQSAQPPVILRTIGPAPVSSTAPRLLAGAGGGAVVATDVRVRTVVAPAPLPAPLPVRYPGSDNDPGVVTMGGVLGAFLPDDMLLAVGPRLVAGSVATALPGVATVLKSASATSSALPLPVLAMGFGQPAQPSVIRGSVVPNQATVLPRPLRFAGFGQPAQPPVVLSSSPPALPAWSSLPSMLAGVVPAPVLASAPVLRTSPPEVPAVRLPSLLMGYGQPAQPPVVLSSSPPALSGWLAMPSVFAGVVSVLASSTVLRASPPEALVVRLPGLLAGFGQAAQPSVVLSISVVPIVEAPPVVRVFAGVVPLATTSGAVVRPSVVPVVEPPPRPTLVAGFGQPAQVARTITSPLSTPSWDLLVAGRLFAGFGQPTPLPVPAVESSPFAPLWPALPLQPVLNAGFGQAAQPPVILSTVNPRSPVELLPRPAMLTGANPPVLPVATVLASLPVPSPSLPPSNAVLAGFGQPSRPAVVYSAARPPESPSLPPLGWLAAGANPPPVFLPIIHRDVKPWSVELPPTPVLRVGFGQAAQPSVILSAQVVPPFTDLPPAVVTFAGVPIQPTASIVLPNPVVEVLLPPAPVLWAGFGQASQVAVVLTIPYGTADATRLPPVPLLFAGFGEPPFIPPLTPADPQYTAVVDFDNYTAEVDRWSPLEMIASYRMDPGAVRTVAIDWARWPFPLGTRIASVSWSVPGAFHVVNQSVFGTKASIKIKPTAAGLLNQDYVLTCTMVTTEQGADPARDVRRIGIQLRER